MKLAGAVALVTGADGGIGSAFVGDLLERGVSKIYVATRGQWPTSRNADGRLVPMTLDVTDLNHVVAAAIAAPDVTLLINNAGYAAFEGAIAAPDLSFARREMEVNYFGPLALTRAFAPVLSLCGGGAVLNMLSMLALVSLPRAATYSASKAALLSATRSMRAELSSNGTIVVGVLAVQTETKMGAELPQPRLTPTEVVRDALDAIEAGKSEEIVAGALSRKAFEAITSDPKAFQSKLSTQLPTVPADVRAKMLIAGAGSSAVRT